MLLGENALNRVQDQDNQIHYIVNKLGTNREKILETFTKNIDELDKSKKKIKSLLKRISRVYSQHILSNSATIESETNRGKFVKLYYVDEDELDEEFHLIVGKNAVDADA